MYGNSIRLQEIKVCFRKAKKIGLTALFEGETGKSA